MNRPTLALALASLAASTGLAHAATFKYADFSNTSAFTFNGVSAPATGVSGLQVLRLTPNQGNSSGAAYLSTPLKLGPNDAFETKFQFQISGTPAQEWSDGLTFVLTTTPTGIGTGSQTGGSIGYEYDYPSVAVIFDTFRYNNVVAAVTNGNLTNVTQQPIRSWAYAYGQADCNRGLPGQSNDGCMIDGDVWTASIKYNGHLLNAWVEDGTGATYQVITNDPIDLSQSIGSGPVYVGFTAGTGLGYANYDVLNWNMRY